MGVACVIGRGVDVEPFVGPADGNPVVGAQDANRTKIIETKNTLFISLAPLDWNNYVGKFYPTFCSWSRLTIFHNLEHLYIARVFFRAVFGAAGFETLDQLLGVLYLGLVLKNGLHFCVPHIGDINGGVRLHGE